jgi:hypothetical protein
MKTFLLQVVVIVSVLIVYVLIGLFILGDALDIPDVHVSHSTNECVKVINYKEGNKYSCTDMPSKYNMIWVK